MSNLRGFASRAFSFVRPRVEKPLWVVLRDDRLLLWATAGLWLAALIPVFLTPFLPFADVPNTTASASLMLPAGFGHGPAATMFRVNWVPTPYLIVYAMIAFIGPVIGPLLAVKLIVALILIAVPLGVMRLMVTLNRSPRLALWTFMLVYDHNLFAGWISYWVGIAFCMFVIAWTLEARNVREAARVALFSALVGVSHVQAVFLLIVALPLLILFGRPIKQRFMVHLVAGGGLALTLVPWLISRMATRRGTPIGSVFAFEFHPPEYKISQFFGYTLETFAKGPSMRLAALAFVAVALGPLCLSLLPRTPTRQHTFTPIGLLAAAVGLYAFLFMSIDGPMVHWYTYPRYASVTLMFMLLLPAPRLDGRWALALIPGLLITLALDYELGTTFRRFRGRSEQLLQIIDHVKPETSMLPLIFDDDVPDPDFKLPPYHQLTSYIAACKTVIMPSMWDYPGFPLVYRDENRKPWPEWDPAAQRAFTMETYGKHYDYVIVQGFERADPVAPLQDGPLPRPHLVAQAGRWRLYEIQR